MEAPHAEHWHLPNWHPDWDGEFSFAAFRTLANAIAAETNLVAFPVVLEEGLAYLAVCDGAIKTAEVYVNRSRSSQVAYSVFAGAEDLELQTHKIEVVVQFLAKHRTAFPDDEM